MHSTCIYIYDYRQHVGTLMEYMWQSEMLQRPRGWTSEMLPIACKYKGRGCYLGTHPMGGGNTGTRGHGTIHIYIYIYILQVISCQTPILHVGHPIIFSFANNLDAPPWEPRNHGFRRDLGRSLRSLVLGGNPMSVESVECHLPGTEVALCQAWRSATG